MEGNNFARNKIMEMNVNKNIPADLIFDSNPIFPRVPKEHTATLCNDVFQAHV